LHRVLPGSGPADGNSARIGRSAATVSQRRRTALAIVRAPGPGRTCASPAGGAAPSPRPTLPRTLAEATSWAAKRQHTSVGCPSSPGADHCHQARPTPSAEASTATPAEDTPGIDRTRDCLASPVDRCGSPRSRRRAAAWPCSECTPSRNTHHHSRPSSSNGRWPAVGLDRAPERDDARGAYRSAQRGARHRLRRLNRKTGRQDRRSSEQRDPRASLRARNHQSSDNGDYVGR
jgi:hypothetical protein